VPKKSIVRSVPELETLICEIRNLAIKLAHGLDQMVSPHHRVMQLPEEFLEIALELRSFNLSECRWLQTVNLQW